MIAFTKDPLKPSEIVARRGGGEEDRMQVFAAILF